MRYFQVKSLLSSSSLDPVWIGLTHHHGQFVWMQIDLALNEGFFVSNASLNESQNVVMTSDGNWTAVDVGFLAPGAVCMSHSQNVNLTAELQNMIDSVQFREMYVDWIVKAFFDSIKVRIVGNGTEQELLYTDLRSVCEANKTSTAFLLTEEKNVEVLL